MSDRRELWLIGAGGHAKVVIDAAHAGSEFRVVGALVDNVPAIGARILGISIHGPVSPDLLRRLGVRHAVIAIGANNIRQRIANGFDGLVDWAIVRHPSAVVSSSARVEAGAVIFAGAIIQAEATIGRHVICNTACSVDHDCWISDFTHLAPGVHLAGSVTIGIGALLGVGVSVIPGRSIGAWSTVGAGAVVVHDLPPDVTARGVPAKAVQ